MEETPESVGHERPSRSRRRRRMMVVGTLLAFGLVSATGMPTVGAQERPDAVAVAERVGGVGSDVVQRGGTLAARDGGPGVRVEARRDAAIQVKHGSDEGVALGIAGRDAARPRVERRGVVFSGGESVDFVARPTRRGGQILVVVRDADAPTSYRFPIRAKAGSEAVVQPDGSVAITSTVNGVTVPDAVIAAPWARDAAGRSVRTWFEVDGTTLVQHVEHHGAKYPVVADPDTHDCGWVTCSYYIGRARTRSIANSVARYANASNAAIAGAFALACAPIGGIGAVVCGVIGAIAGGFAIDQFMEARRTGKCIRIRYIRGTTQVTGIYVDGGGHCKS